MSTATLEGLHEPDILMLHESKTNPRKTYDQAGLEQLAESIKVKGILQPIVVRPAKKGFEIVCGHRRYRAAKLAGLARIPVMVRDLSDAEALEVQVIENAQRADVHPLEESDAFQRLIEMGQHTPATLGEKLGKPVAYVLGRLRLQRLGKQARELFGTGFIGVGIGHVLTIAMLPEEQQDKVIKDTCKSWDGKQWREQTSSVSDWARAARQFQQVFTAATWDLNDANLLPQAGACNTCLKRSGVGLFDEEEDGKGRCFDWQCFQAKRSAVEARLVAEAQAQNPGIRTVARAPWNAKLQPEGEHTHPVIVSTGEDAGKVIYLTLRDAENRKETPEEQAAREARESARTLAAKQKASDENAYRKAAIQAIVKELESRGIADELVQGLLKLTAKRLWSICGQSQRHDALDHLGLKKSTKLEEVPDSKFSILAAILLMLEGPLNEWAFMGTNPPQPPEGINVLAELVGVNLKDVRLNCDMPKVKAPKKGDAR